MLAALSFVLHVARRLRLFAGAPPPVSDRAGERLRSAFVYALAQVRVYRDPRAGLMHTHQIGQTWRNVKPQLYVAAGIGGAIQHKVGMQTSGTIVAINRDSDTRIAEFADLMVVGDLFEIAPRLSAAQRSRRER